ncbi:Protein MRPL-50 [Aphelenchoides avenae]|nr:Protein MRPL-50 [Aphelenchus avenae]
MITRRLVPSVRQSAQFLCAHRSYAKQDLDAKELTEQDKEQLKRVIPRILVGKDREPTITTKPTPAASLVAVEKDEEQEAVMDSIRARGFMKHTYKYTPAPDVEAVVREKATASGVTTQSSDAHWMSAPLSDLAAKEKLLLDLGQRYRHFVSNAKLHQMKTIGDVVDFYTTPVDNIPTYARMARDKSLPENLAIREHPARFHPNDIHAPHGGITAFPGDGGEVLSIRNKRLYRQFRPKKEWFDYEEQAFDYTPMDKNLPWDPEMIRKMDRYTDKKFYLGGVKVIKRAQ